MRCRCPGLTGFNCTVKPLFYGRMMYRSKLGIERRWPLKLIKTKWVLDIKDPFVLVIFNRLLNSVHNFAIDFPIGFNTHFIAQKRRKIASINGAGGGGGARPNFFLILQRT